MTLASALQAAAAGSSATTTAAPPSPPAKPVGPLPQRQRRLSLSSLPMGHGGPSRFLSDFEEDAAVVGGATPTQSSATNSAASGAGTSSTIRTVVRVRVRGWA